MRKLIALILSLTAVLAISGCASQSQNLTENIEPLASTDDLPLEHTGTGVVTDFAVRLLQNTADPGENTLISPLSVQTALGMTMFGAEGDTLTQMEAVLGEKRENLNPLLGDYLKAVVGEQFHAAKAIWFTDREDFAVQEEFLRTNKSIYNAEIYQAPMNSGTANEINRWVNKQTHEMIPKIVDRLPEDTVMCLVNALAFEGEWPEPYKETQVREGDFHREGEGLVQVEFLCGSEYQYLSGEHCTGFIKPYQGGRYAFAALLPEENRTVEELLASLDGEQLADLLSAASQEEVITRIPKFSTEYTVELSETLADMGMPLAFSMEADFSSVGETNEGIFISQVLHKTFLELGEKGTRAGAATAVIMPESCAPEIQEKPKEVILDRPFLYMLLDIETRTPFFLGIMQDPS